MTTQCMGCKRIKGGATVASIGLLASISANTYLIHPHQASSLPAPTIDVDKEAVIQRLADAVKIQTISIDGHPNASAPAFLALHEHLLRSFPHVHQVLQQEVVNQYSLLYTWQGTDPDLAPIILMAHQDVVPITPETRGDWHHDPFAGVIRDGYVWGRGSWDDKGNLMAMMEAIEKLITSGYQPRRTIYLAFGHDEEMGAAGGQQGARAIAELLRQRHVHAAMALDEGLLITQGVMKGLDAPVALVGIAEKGYLTARLSSDGVAGHSSSPPKHTAIGNLSEALNQLEDHPMPAQINGVAKEMFDVLAPEFHGANRVFLSNLWLFGPLVAQQLAQLPSGNAMLRTSTALTTVHAGDKENVIPGRASATVNFRLMPGDSTDAVFAHAKEAVTSTGVKLTRVEPSWEASPISSTSDWTFDALEQTIKGTFPGTVVAPGLMIGATDSRYMAGIAQQVYRFTPLLVKSEDLPRFHGTDERVAVNAYIQMIHFYHSLLGQLDQPTRTLH